MVILVNQQINRTLQYTLSKIWEISRAEMVILVNQRINRNLRTIPYFPDFREETLTLGNQQINKDMTHTLVKI